MDYASISLVRHTKGGSNLSRLFSHDSPFIQKINQIADFVLLNLCFLICCLPVFTIGAAFVSLYEASFSFVEKNDTGMGVFLQAFRQNLKTATLPFLLMLGIGLFLAFDLWIVASISLPFYGIIIVVLGFCLAVYLLMLTQFFMIQAKFRCTLRQLLRNSLLIAFANIFRTLSILVMTGFPILLLAIDAWVLMSVMPVFLLAYWSLIGYLGAKLMQKPFVRYAEAITESSEAGKLEEQ